MISAFSQIGGSPNLGAAPNRSAPLNRGLVGWWLVLPGNAPRSGGRWLDLLGRYNGTLTSSTALPTWAAKMRPGGWASLSTGAAAGYVQLPAILSQTVFTLAAWINTSANTGVIISNLGGGFGGQEWAIGDTVGSGKPGLWNGTSWVGSGNTTVNDGAWHHLAVTHASGGPAVFYKDGKLESSVAHADPSAGGNNMRIGRRGGGGSTIFSGNLDDVRIYNRALGDDEIARLYDASRTRYQNELNWLPRRLGNVAAASSFTQKQSSMLLCF